VLVAAAFAGIGAAAVAGHDPKETTPAPPSAPPATNVWIERDGLRYEYSSLSGRERLFEVGVPDDQRRDLAPSRPDDARRLRRLLEEQLSVPDLDVLHEPHRATAENLRAMGYL
jgi:hypothetical protein